MKLWSGRFSKETDAGVNDFNSSISFDWVMYKEDIAGSIAHAGMLADCGVISQSDAELIVGGLRGILSDIESGALQFDPLAEDIHMFIEQVLTQRIGDAGKRLHTARSRNDQVALDIRMYLRNRVAELESLTASLINAIIDISKRHLLTVMPGYTHMQVAQPVTFGHHLMAYAWMLRRDFGRLGDCKRRMNLSPLGSGALAGTTYPIDRQSTALALGFSGAIPNSMDAVSDRDFCVELGSALSIIMTHLSRLSEELVIWCSSEFGFVELDDAFATGSSIMPQKKNPDVAELIRGKTGRVNGNLVTLLTMLKGLPLSYNKDMQEDKQAIFDSVDTAALCLDLMSSMLLSMTPRADRMRAAAAKGFINATDCADYLVRKGMPFRDAHRVVGELVAKCISDGLTLEALPISDYRAASELFDTDIYAAVDLTACVEGRGVEGGPAPDAVRRQIELLEGLMAEQSKNNHLSR